MARWLEPQRLFGTLERVLKSCVISRWQGVVGIGDQLHPLARIRRSARRSARTRPLWLWLYSTRDAYESNERYTVVAPSTNPSRARRFPYGIDEHLTAVSCVAARRQRPSTSERRGDFDPLRGKRATTAFSIA